MITKFVIKDAHVPAGIVETMERRIHQRMDAYFKDEAEGDTVIGVRITEQKNTYKVELTMPYMGHTLRTENQEREISLPALDKGIDVLERQMKKLRTRLARDLRKKPPWQKPRRRRMTMTKRKTSLSALNAMRPSP